MQVWNWCGKPIKTSADDTFHICYHHPYGSRFDGSVTELDFCNDCTDVLTAFLQTCCKYNPTRSEDEFQFPEDDDDDSTPADYFRGTPLF